MDLTVIIVNYNVKHFLEQCLRSVYKSLERLQGEVIVVDNNSVDGSCQMLKEKFPYVILIENKENLGFSKANNQGIKISKGKYILLLNPDTIVQEDTFLKCLNFMESHADAGCLGVKMIDGKGNFLPESKRSMPTPRVSFFKIFGLSALFPKSKLFGRYHLGYLDKNITHKIEILPGAFMFIRKSVLEKTGILDESFFMYGEDIDLSYRIRLAGFENYYYPETTIIHYKGESTKKGSINYVVLFYKAMIIFARKHFTPKNAFLFSLLINIAIYFRASLSILRRLFLSIITPLTDALLIYLGFYIIQPLWAVYKFNNPQYYPNEYLLYVVPVYIFIWLSCVYISGGYEKRVPVIDLLKGIATGTLGILLIYALLPESMRYSRALVVFGSIWAALSFFISRLTQGIILNTVQVLFKKQKKRIAIVGSPDESDRVITILTQVNISPIFIGLVNWHDRWDGEKYIGDISQLEEIVPVNRIDEIVFCAKDIPSQEIIQAMLRLGDIAVEYKIAPTESFSVIGSNSIHTAGEFYVMNINTLSHSFVKRKKRIFDLVISILLFCSSPVSIFIVKKPIGFYRNILHVIFKYKTWVGLARTNHDDGYLIDMRPGILTPIPASKEKSINDETIKRLNLLYAKDYKLINDISIIIRDFKYLGK
jgi:GT2 family glycosyltransferase